MPWSYGKKALTQTKSKPAHVLEAGTSSKLDTDVFEAVSISGGDVKAVASTNTLANSWATLATVLVACPDSLATVAMLRGVKKQAPPLLLGAADGGGLGGWSAARAAALGYAVVESEAGPTIRGGGPGGGGG